MLVHRIAPFPTADPGAYALVGMGTLFAGIIRAPMTSVFMIFEITQDYQILVPLMVANLLSFVDLEALSADAALSRAAASGRRASAVGRAARICRRVGPRADMMGRDMPDHPGPHPDRGCLEPAGRHDRTDRRRRRVRHRCGRAGAARGRRRRRPRRGAGVVNRRSARHPRASRSPVRRGAGTFSRRRRGVAGRQPGRCDPHRRRDHARQHHGCGRPANAPPHHWAIEATTVDGADSDGTRADPRTFSSTMTKAAAF